jgi:tetratricopeptide (TPR) repeat protein
MPYQPPRVFISYSHDSPKHAQHVLELAERLRKDGIDAQLDQYVAGTPAEGWPRWMLDRLDWADFVLVTCTETYYRRFRGHEEDRGKGRGADWEGNLITLEMYDAKSRTTKFAPIFFNPLDEQFVPEPVSGHTQYLLNSEENYAKLYAFLTGQAGVRPGELGSLKTLARNPVEPLTFAIHNLPFSPNPTFTGRDAELKNLCEQLQKGGTVAVHGLGGVGKTQLAVEYAWKHLSDFEAVLWVKADRPETLEASLSAFAYLLGLPEANEREQAIQIKAILGWLRAHERWLLIADNADTELAARAVRDRFSPNLRGTVLVTSRLSRWPVNMPHLPLDLLLPKDAVSFLLERVAKEGHNAGDETAARSLANELGHLPLALEQAAAFIIEMRWSFDKYREQLREARPELLNYQAEGGTRYPASIAKTWSITLDQLSPLARTLLQIAAWYARGTIPRDVFLADQRVFSEALDESFNVSPITIERVLGELDRFSLVRLTSETVSVHRLLQAVEQDSLGEGESKRCLAGACRLFNAFAPESPDDVSTWKTWLSLSQHAETLIEHTKRHSVDEKSVAFLANQFGVFLKTRGVYAEAEPLYKRALEIWEKALGPEHPEMATGLINLAALYRAQGRYAEAEPLYKQALEILVKALRPEHFKVATGIAGLAGLYHEQGRYAEAEPLFKRALEIRKKALPAEHPDVATSVNDLATLYDEQGRYAEAEPLYKLALEIQKKALPAEHPDMATNLNNLAELYHNQGRYAEAKPLYKQALEIREKALGPEHPKVATSLNNQAAFYCNQGQYAEAKPLFERALGIRIKALGPEHPNVAQSLNNLAALYYNQGQHAEAEPLYKRALKIREKVLGPEHPDVAQSLNNLAELYKTQDQYAEAEPLYKRALEIWQKALGSEHPEVATGLNNLAELYRAQGRYAEAEPLYKRALEIREKVLGPKHPVVATNLNNLALLYDDQGQYGNAEPPLRRVLEIWEEALGPEHPDVAESLDDLAACYYKQGQYPKAESLAHRVLESREKTLGPEHPKVAESLNNLAAVYRAQRKYAKAEPLYKRALDIGEKAFGSEHPVVATSLEYYAFLLRNMGRSEDAQPLEARARAIRGKSP